MDWTKIQEKYPKALKKYFEFEKWQSPFEDTQLIDGDADVYIRNTDHTESSLCYKRDLYDFFDEQGIVIEIAYAPSKELGGKIEFYYDFCLDDFPAFESRNHFKTRTEAETEAFEKAFQLLEERGTNDLL